MNPVSKRHLKKRTIFLEEHRQAPRICSKNYNRCGPLAQLESDSVLPIAKPQGGNRSDLHVYKPQGHQKIGCPLGCWSIKIRKKKPTKHTSKNQKSSKFGVIYTSWR
jgi:hypothetical protein